VPEHFRVFCRYQGRLDQFERCERYLPLADCWRRVWRWNLLRLGYGNLTTTKHYIITNRSTAHDCSQGLIRRFHYGDGSTRSFLSCRLSTHLSRVLHHPFSCVLSLPISLLAFTQPYTASTLPCWTRLRNTVPILTLTAFTTCHDHPNVQV
jgi:hypothetical protein